MFACTAATAGRIMRVTVNANWTADRRTSDRSTGENGLVAQNRLASVFLRMSGKIAAIKEVRYVNNASVDRLRGYPFGAA